MFISISFGRSFYLIIDIKFSYYCMIILTLELVDPFWSLHVMFSFPLICLLMGASHSGNILWSLYICSVKSISPIKVLEMTLTWGYTLCSFLHSNHRVLNISYDYSLGYFSPRCLVCFLIYPQIYALLLHPLFFKFTHRMNPFMDYAQF